MCCPYCFGDFFWFIPDGAGLEKPGKWFEQAAAFDLVKPRISEKFTTYYCRI